MWRQVSMVLLSMSVVGLVGCEGSNGGEGEGEGEGAELSAQTLDVSSIAGLTATITVTRRGSWSSDFGGAPSFDDLVLNGTGGDLALLNGTFDTDLTGWTIAPQAELQNLTTAPQTLVGLDVTRSFFTIPNRIWARSVDTFTNTTDAAITATVSYLSNLGSDDNGVVFDLGGTAVSSWDMRQSDPDVGFVFGDGATITSFSATGTRTEAGSFDITRATGDAELSGDDVRAVYTITVEPGASVSLAVFTIMSPVVTGDTAADSSVHPALVESTIAAIQANARTDGQYFTGMTQAQIDALQNF